MDWHAITQRLRTAIKQHPNCDFTVCKELHNYEAAGIEIPTSVDQLRLALSELDAQVDYDTCTGVGNQPDQPPIQYPFLWSYYSQARLDMLGIRRIE